MKHLKRLGIICLIVLAIIFFPITIVGGIIAGIIALFRAVPRIKQTLMDISVQREEHRDCKEFLHNISQKTSQEQTKDFPRKPCVQKTDNYYYQSYRRETFTLFKYTGKSPGQKSAEYYRVREIKDPNSDKLKPPYVSRKTAFLRQFISQ